MELQQKIVEKENIVKKFRRMFMMIMMPKLQWK
jgi:hypothetical protein